MYMYIVAFLHLHIHIHVYDLPIAISTAYLNAVLAERTDMLLSEENKLSRLYCIVVTRHSFFARVKINTCTGAYTSIIN